MKNIVTITLNPAIDIHTHIDKLKPEQKLRCYDTDHNAGGGGINVSKALMELGMVSTAIYQSGGLNGQKLEALMTESGIHSLPIYTQEDTRENFIVLDKNSNAQYRFGMPGPVLTLEEYDSFLVALEKLSPRPDIVIASGSLPPNAPIDIYARMAETSKKIGAKFILDTSGPALLSAANEGVYLLKPNLQELSHLYETEELVLNDVDNAAQYIIKKGYCELVVVSLGHQGAILVSGEDYIHIPAPDVKKITTVGAGDSMVAGLVYGMSKELTNKETIMYGVACGTAATMNSGKKLFEKAVMDEQLEWIKLNYSKFQLNFEGRTNL